MASYYVDGKQYAFEKRNLLCEAYISKSEQLFDLFEKKQRLYISKKKAFLIATYCGNTEIPEKIEIVTRVDAVKFMNEHPAGIKVDVYNKIFGVPEEG